MGLRGTAALLGVAGAMHLGCSGTPNDTGDGENGGGAGAPAATGGSGGAPEAAPCPGVPPTEGAACVTPKSCFYEACTNAGDLGRTVATCRTDGWHVETGPCTPVACGGTGEQCLVGELCQQPEAGSPQCVENPYGSGPIEPDCCAVSGDLDGIRITCTSITTSHCTSG